jgi:hypothetical protein
VVRASGVRCEVWETAGGQRRVQRFLDLPELGKHPRTAPGRLTCSSEGVGTNRGCPWMTAADRCLGHVGGTAGEDDVARSLSATVASLTGG